jgi:3',5'-cyclic AMP phosphodiesterase CpdA
VATTTRILHVSDFHVGAHDDGRREVEDAVRALAADLAPELVIASGDLSHRNRAAEHARAAAFLRSLELPLLVLPGNHDLPSAPPWRLTAPYARFLAEWPETEPVYRSDTAVVCGLNSVRPWKYQRGGIGKGQIDHARQAFAGAPDGSLRIVALHHHLATPPWRTGKRTVPRRSAVLAGLVEAGAELVVGGHTHQGVVLERREFESVALRGVVLAGAPGLGRPRPGRHAEACGVQVYETARERLLVVTHAWTGGKLAVVAERAFPRQPF